MTLRLNPDIETCPCHVCRSDMAYIHPFCESPIIIIPTMVIDVIPAPVAAPQDGVSGTVTTAHTK